jgi:uncharacterized phage protein (TIGR01671 family)
MREIKFRVFWVNKMLFTDKGDFVIYRGTPRLNEYGDMIGMSNCSDLMQYTGLKDMHGKEIYEGDVFKLKNHIYEVKIMDDLTRFGAKVLDKNSVLCHGVTFPLWQYAEETEKEVIGNIYEREEIK